MVRGRTGYGSEDANPACLGYLYNLGSWQPEETEEYISASRRLESRYSDYVEGKIGFGELDASVQGWINHVRYADTWGLRRHVLDRVADRVYRR